MRVITGSARGRKLKELKGAGSRPTLDRVKEAIFNIIQFDIEGRRVLDLFAGTGQLGIEALSRGAAGAVFVDESLGATRLIAENLRHTQLEERARVIRADAIGYLRRGESFDLVFLDPPYSVNLLEKSIKAILEFDILRENGIMVCESAADRRLPDLSGMGYAAREYKYGRVKLTVYVRAGGAP